MTPDPSLPTSPLSSVLSLSSRWRRPLLRRPPGLVAGLLATLALALLPGPAAAQGMCPGEPLCRAVPRVTATVTDFRVSPNTQGTRPIQLAVRFTNRSQAPLVLGYVDGTAAAYDDRGHKYTLQNSRKLTGLGRIERQRFDPKFSLAPGESADARMELNFYVGRQVIVGTAFDLELGVREIDPLPGQQHRLGREHALSWQSLRHGDGGQAPAAAPGPGTPSAGQAGPPPVGAPPAATASPPPADACGGNPACTVSGPGQARVLGVAPAAPRGNNQEVTVRIEFTNLGAAPLILNYKQDTGVMLDEHGERYIVDGRYRQSVQGMPVATRERASSQFTLGVGEARAASFVFRRFVGKVPPGTVFVPALAIEQYLLLPSHQLQLVREHALGFGELRAGGPAAGPADLRQLGQALDALGQLLKPRP